MSKQYKLIKKYPSLADDWEVGMIVGQGDRGSYATYSPCHGKYSDRHISSYEVHNHPEFWEEVVEYKCGQLCYRIWANGEKSLGRFARYENSELCFTSNSKPRYFYALETYKKEGEVVKNNIYGLGNFKYEVVEKEFEILCFKNIETRKETPVKDFTFEDGGFLFNVDTGNFYPSKDVCNYILENYSIHSVKRLSDGEVFTVGDKTDYGVIKKFILEKDNVLEIYFSPDFYDGNILNKIKKIKQPLFTTEDGVDIFEGDYYHLVYFEKGRVGLPKGTDLFTVSITHKAEALGKEETWSTNCKFFSKKEAAEEYILLNKPCLSINDIRKCINETELGIEDEHTLNHEMIKLVKSKLCK
jgi:hypothetical protein